MTIFFTADTHFGDHRVLNISKRPFGSVAEMDAAMIARWNSVVASEDESGILVTSPEPGKLRQSPCPS